MIICLDTTETYRNFHLDSPSFRLLQQFLIQKQAFQSQLLEVDNALKEIENVESGYKVIGSIMVETKKENLQKDLDEKKEILEVRIKNINKQESKIKEEVQSLQETILKRIKEKE